jgi:outer membrane protein TolC
MKRETRDLWCVILASVMLATGCHPQQPFYFMEDGDLSHYVDVATDIEFADVEHPSLDEVTGALAPLTLRNNENYEMWDLSLEEATRITLCNSQVMRQIGGRVASNAPETLSRTIVNSAAVTTTYDPALVETGNGASYGSQFDGTGVESALAAFDAQLTSSINWSKNDRPINIGGGFAQFLTPQFQQDLGNFNAAITKTTAEGGQWGFRNITDYDQNNNPNRAAPSDWETSFETFFTQPLFQGRGAQYNRIAGPFSFDQYASNQQNSFDGVMIARIRTDLTLADFEGSVRNLMRDVEQSYWELYFAYRDLEARKYGRDSALETWRKVNELGKQGMRGGEADREAQARAQYYQFRSQVEQGLTALYRAESRLRYVMGLAVSDGRLIRPVDEPTTAPLDFDWASVHSEAVVRRVEVRKQKWQVKRRELELIAARNHLLPRLDAVGTYRWFGAGDSLIDNTGVAPFGEGSSAFETLTTGDYQEWSLGLQLAVPLGFRRQMDTVRHVQLLLARERAILQDLELEVSHQLGDSIRELAGNYVLTETNFNRRVAAEREVAAVEQSLELRLVTLDQLLDAQRRRAEAESAYYRSLIDYNLAIIEVHFRKGSLLDYNSVYLAEGPWPGKAYFDALRQARKRDASMSLDYGFTRPSVISRGPHSQSSGGLFGVPAGEVYDGSSMQPTPAEPEPIEPGSTNGARVAPGTSQVMQVGYDDSAAAPAAARSNRWAGLSPATVPAAGTVQPASYEQPTNQHAAGYSPQVSPAGPVQRR